MYIYETSPNNNKNEKSWRKFAEGEKYFNLQIFLKKYLTCTLLFN